jgi:hypothetical protein
MFYYFNNLAPMLLFAVIVAVCMYARTCTGGQAVLPVAAAGFS